MILTAWHSTVLGVAAPAVACFRRREAAPAAQWWSGLLSVRYATSFRNSGLSQSMFDAVGLVVWLQGAIVCIEQVRCQ